MVSRPQVTVGKPATNTNNLRVNILVAYVIADLLVASHGRERYNRIDVRLLAAQCHAGGCTHHIGLGDPHIEEPSRKISAKALQDREAQVSRQQHDSFIFPCGISERANKRVSHCTLPDSSSFIAEAYCSESGLL